MAPPPILSGGWLLSRPLYPAGTAAGGSVATNINWLHGQQSIASGKHIRWWLRYHVGRLQHVIEGLDSSSMVHLRVRILDFLKTHDFHTCMWVHRSIRIKGSQGAFFLIWMSKCPKAGVLLTVGLRSETF